MIEHILTSLEKFKERDSGWMLSRILNLTVNINNLLHARYRIESREIKMKRAVVNMQKTMDNAFCLVNGCRSTPI